MYVACVKGKKQPKSQRKFLILAPDQIDTQTTAVCSGHILTFESEPENPKAVGQSFRKSEQEISTGRLCKLSSVAELRDSIFF